MTVCVAGASSLCSSPDVEAMPPGQPLAKVAATPVPPGHRKAPKIGLIRSVNAVSVWFILLCMLHVVESFALFC